MHALHIYSAALDFIPKLKMQLSVVLVAKSVGLRRLVSQWWLAEDFST